MRSEARIIITNPTGLHARPAVKIAQLAADFDANVEVRVDDRGDWVRARSTAQVMKLKALARSVLHFRADGAQADDAVSALVDFVRRDFDERPGAAEAPAPTAGFDPEGSRGDTGLAIHPGERILEAEAASRGLAVGALHLLEDAGAERTGNPARRQGDAAVEREALDTAVKRSIGQLHALADETDELATDLIAFQVNLLNDEEFLGPAWSAIGGGASAESAWSQHLAGEIADYESAESAYLRDRTADLRDLRDRVSMALRGIEHKRRLPTGAIVVMDELTPSHFLELDWSQVAGIATFQGSTAGHAAMLARARGIPFLVRLARDGADFTEGAPAIINAERGVLILEPCADTSSACERRIAERREHIHQALGHAARPARTSTGTPITMLINVDEPGLLDSVDARHCDGVGLTRTEFLFHGGSELPDEEMQLKFYRRLLNWAGPRSVTVRTLDAGGDKPVAGLTVDGEPNPFMGLRGVRLSLARPEVFRVQLRALARAAPLGKLKVMVPMVTVPAEMARVRAMFEEEITALRDAGIEAAMPSLGMMVEVPAAAFSIETFDADFLSIGTNDLTSYLLAVARDAEIAGDLLDPLHPAVSDLVARVAAYGVASGKEVSVCGEMAADPACLSVLLEAGIRILSVPPAALASTKAALAAL